MYRILKQLIVLACIAAITSISSCCPKVDCAIPMPGIRIRFQGFQPADLDTIYTTGYAAGTGFTQITREEQIDTIEAAYGDSIFYLQPKSGYFLSDAHQWKIYIPSVNRTLYISDYGYRLFNCNKCMFRKSTPDTRALHSCILNGQRQDIEYLRVDK